MWNGPKNSCLPVSFSQTHFVRIPKFRTQLFPESADHAATMMFRWNNFGLSKSAWERLATTVPDLVARGEVHSLATLLKNEGVRFPDYEGVTLKAIERAAPTTSSTLSETQIRVALGWLVNGWGGMEALPETKTLRSDRLQAAEVEGQLQRMEDLLEFAARDARIAPHYQKWAQLFPAPPSIGVKYLTYYLRDLLQTSLACSSIGQQQYSDAVLTGLEQLTEHILGLPLPALLVANLLARDVLGGHFDVERGLNAISLGLHTLIERLDQDHHAELVVVEDVDLPPELPRDGLLLPITPKLTPQTESNSQAAHEWSNAYVAFFSSYQSINSAAMDLVEAELTGLPVGAQALVLGAPMGMAHQLATRPNLFRGVCLVDRSSFMCARTTLFEKAMGPHLRGAPVEVMQDDVLDHEIPSHAFSLVLVDHLLEYVPPDGRRLLYQRLGAGLVQGGKILYRVYLRDSLRYRGYEKDPIAREIAPGLISFDGGLKKGNKYRARHAKYHFSSGELARELAEAGFTRAQGFRVLQRPKKLLSGLGDMTQEVVVKKVGP